jgi:hypothetical protein
MALRTNGTDQGLSVIAPRSQFRNLSEATICCWANFDPFATTNRIMIKFSTATGSNTTRISLAITTALRIEVACRILDGDSLAIHQITLSTPPGPGEWHHYAVAFSFTFRRFQLYYDGELLNTTSMTAVTAGNTSDTDSLSGGIAIANPPTGNSFWPGLIDDMRIYQRLLGPAEIATIKTSLGADAIMGSLVSRWTLNELAPDVAVVGAADVSGNGAMALPIGVPVYGPGIGRPRMRQMPPIGAQR